MMRPYLRVTTILFGVAQLMSAIAVIVLVASSSAPALLAQLSSSEDEIRRLEQLEVRALMARDTAVLRRLWDSGYIVNNPDTVVVEAKPAVTDRPVMQKPRMSMTRTPEKITFRSDFAIAMGSETIVPGEG